MASHPVRDPYATGRPRNHPCVRCGRNDAEAELFICHACHVDPDREREQRWIEERVTDGKMQRRELVLRFGWAGGWWHL
jgi:ribosomal protein L37E